MDCCSGLCACFVGKACQAQEDDDVLESFDLFFELQALQIATGFFSDVNKLGHGGFGPVYKGLLPNGVEVAVKKLSLDSRQGVREFTNEVKLLLRVQHKNLVMLLGCCVQGPEKMLVYEYLPNKSLDFFIFDQTKSASLDWMTRFRIIVGVARGLLYLHEEAPERIIHRDIKASNILLDEKLNPKIADFGLARLFPGEDTHLDTFRISGTHGYMAPEYALHGYLSVKTDVFSYGVLVLEIVSGRRTHDRLLEREKADLLSYAWMLYEAGKAMDLVDPSLAKYNRDEVAMCIQVGLLCCQASLANRPDMNSVHLMFSSDSFTLPRPGKPGLIGRGGWWSTTSTSALTNNTNGSSGFTGGTKASEGSSFVEEHSRNSISISSIDEDSEPERVELEVEEEPPTLINHHPLLVFGATISAASAISFNPTCSAGFRKSREDMDYLGLKPNWELRKCCDHDQTRFLITTAVFMVVILVLWRTVVMTPFKLITVFLHEVSHALACWLTCGKVEGIQVHADEGGVTQTRGGIYWIILPAGYLGSSFWGMTLILASTNGITTQIAAGCFTFALVIVLFLAKNWTLRGLCLGFLLLFGLTWFLQVYTVVRILREVILFTGIMNSLFSVYDIYDDTISRRINSSDAEKFAEECPCCTGCGWGVIWGFFSFVYLCVAVYLALVILANKP